MAVENAPGPRLKMPPLRAWKVTRYNMATEQVEAILVTGHQVAFPQPEVLAFLEFTIDQETQTSSSMNRRSFHGWMDFEEVAVVVMPNPEQVQ